MLTKKSKFSGRHILFSILEEDELPRRRPSSSFARPKFIGPPSESVLGVDELLRPFGRKLVGHPSAPVLEVGCPPESFLAIISVFPNLPG